MARPTQADAELLLHLYEVRRDPELRRARAWFLTDFKPQSWSEIKARYLSHDEADRHFRMTISYWEMVATLVNHGTLNAELFFDHTGEDIVTWERIKALIPDARADIRPTYMLNFERLVAGHQAYRKRTNEAALKPAKRTGPEARPSKTKPQSPRKR